MKLQTKNKWMMLLSVLLTFSTFAMASSSEAQSGGVGTQTCINCHQTWLDNNPPLEDVISNLLYIDYIPVILASSHGEKSFYTIPEGYVSSVHYLTDFSPNSDYVTCEACHGSGLSHYGVGSIPTPIPQAKTCGNCHSTTIKEYQLTSHANSNKSPGRYYDQPLNGTGQAKTSFPNLGQPFSLYKKDQSTIVTRNERIEECSVCHLYALTYPQFTKKIAQGNFLNPQVSCGACHDAHIVGPRWDQSAQVNSTVKITGIAGTSTITAVTPVTGRNVTYVNNKPYKVNDGGAQDAVNGIWTRGSAINRPSPIIVSGIGTISNSGSGVADRMTFSTGLSTDRVRPGNTLFVSGEASATVNLPADAVNAGAPITVKAIFDKAGFRVANTIDFENILIGVFDQTLIIDTREDPAIAEMIEQLGTDKIGFVAKASVTYKKTAGGTGTRNVFIPFNGTVNFEVRDMRTNTETLCTSCHTQGKHKYSAWGWSSGKFNDLSSTHNKNIGEQYRNSGHANTEALPFLEFSAYDYGSTHQAIYPFDMSISGAPIALNALQNKGNSSYQLTKTPNAANAYLANVNNTSQVVLINNYACNQCHHGLGSVDYMKDRQGTPEAQVLWGDATVTCLTCHETHKDSNKTGKNVRVPLKLSYNSRFVDSAKNSRGGINKFMDGTDIPSGVGDSKVCLFCHQGRESGLTVYTAIKGNVDPYTKPDQVINPAGVSFLNPHYLDSGAILWSKNAWEYFFNGVSQTYSNGLPTHQQTNCTGCHMSPPEGTITVDKKNPVAEQTGIVEGGHTWRPSLETCQKCHGSLDSFFSKAASGDYDGDGKVKTTYEEFGTLSPDGSTGTGLFGQVVAALKAKGILYNPNSYPYFFTTSGAQFRAWTSSTLSAAFNLSYAYKAGNAVYVHNAWYVAQILQDSLKALGATPKPWFRPSGERNATDYRTIVVNP